MAPQGPRGRRGPKSLTPPRTGAWRERELRARALGIPPERFWHDLTEEERRDAEDLAEARREELERSLFRVAWWHAGWTVSGRVPDWREVEALITGKPVAPRSPGELLARLKDTLSRAGISPERAGLEVRGG